MNEVVGLILAGGKGERLGSVGTYLPKCLLPVGAHLVLERLCAHCEQAGASHVLLSVSARYGDLAQAFVAASDLALPVEVVVEHEPLGPAKALASFAPRMRDCTTLLFLGDVYFSSDLPFLSLRPKLSSMDTGGMLLGVIAGSSPQQISCVVEYDETDEAHRVIERPQKGETQSDSRWACFAALGPGALNHAEAAMGNFRTPHIGDALEEIRRNSFQASVVHTGCFEVNINTQADALLANLVQTYLELDPKERNLRAAAQIHIERIAAQIGVPIQSLPF